MLQDLALAVFAIALLTILVLTAPQHGPWFDEFWTRFFSDPTVSLSYAFSDRWAADVHPPLFSFLAWLAAHVETLPIEQARLLNLAPFTLLTVYLALLGRALPQERPFLAVLVISVGASHFAIDYFSEFRSYFTGLCAFTALVATLIAQDRNPRGHPAPAASLLWCGYGISLAICLNIHYLTMAMTTVLVGAFGVAALIAGDRRRFIVYLITGIIFSAPFLAFLAYQHATIERISADYWMKTSIPAAGQLIIDAMGTPISHAQVGVTLVWGVAALLFLRRQERHALERTVTVLMIAIVAEVVMLLIYTSLTAALIERHLIPLAILSAALFSIILSRTIFSHRWLFLLFIAVNLAAAIVAAEPRWRDPRWDEAAQFLADKQKACPGARIIPMQQNPNDHTPNSIENYNQAYAYMASKWGLTLGPVDTPSTRPKDPLCPDYYWADHFFGSEKSPETLMAQFAIRWPQLRACRATGETFTSGSAVFVVSGDAPDCAR